MSHTRSHLVSGGTGFIGRALILELLVRTDSDIICLVRSADSPERARERLHEALSEAAAAYGAGSTVTEGIPRRCRAIGADIEDSLDDVAATLLGQVDQIWHCAATLNYRERHRPAIERTNIAGTGRVLRLAEIVGAHGFHYISTAYVAGSSDGYIPELPVRAATHNNVYEDSKQRAEELVLTRAPAGLRVTVLRPSVVVGHSRTSAVSGRLSGMYGLARELAKYASSDGRPPGQPRFCLSPDATVDLVPIDQVAREAVACGLRGADQTVYHLTGGRPVDVGVLLQTICRAVGLSEPVLLADPADLREPEQQLGKRLGSYYAQYLQGDKRFARVNTDALSQGDPPTGVNNATLSNLCAWYAAHHIRTTAAGALAPALADGLPGSPESPVTRVVLVGGGYATLNAYRAIRRRARRAIARGSVQISIIAPGQVHRFHGWTGEVISGILAPPNIPTALADVCPDAEVIDGTVTGVDLSGRTVTVAVAGTPQQPGPAPVTVLRYDHLVLGPGAADSKLVPGLAANTLSPKKPRDLHDLWQRLRKLAAAGSSTSMLPIVVIGGGLAGVETCAAIAELFARSGPGSRPRIVLVHSGAAILPELLPRFGRLARYARRQLAGYGVEVRTGARVTEVLEIGVALDDGTMIPAELVINALGQRPVRIPGTDALERTADERIRTDGYLRVPGQRRVWAGGDVAAVPHLVTGIACPANALWAIKHGSFIGRNIARDLRGRRPRRFSYLGLGRAGSLGAGKGIVHLYGAQLTGRVAWLLRAALFLWFMPSRQRAAGTARELLGLMGGESAKLGIMQNPGTDPSPGPARLSVAHRNHQVSVPDREMIPSEPPLPVRK